MRISKAADYSVRALIYIASRKTAAPAGVAEIAAAMDAPKPFLVKILNNLARAGLVLSHRGASGGYTLAKPVKDVTLRTIVEAVDGPIALNVCLNPGGCGRSGDCGIFAAWVDVQAKLLAVMESYTLADMSAPFRKSSLGRNKRKNQER
jgi:Rrf2 family protein